MVSVRGSVLISYLATACIVVCDMFLCSVQFICILVQVKCGVGVVEGVVVVVGIVFILWPVCIREVLVVICVVEHVGLLFFCVWM